MPIVGNRHYNSPEIGAAFQGLASLFAPPSAQDTAAYAAAKAKSEEAEREAEAYAQMTAEGVSPEMVDRYGVAIGRFNPTQSYRALAVGDATTRRGQDIESGDRRYGADQVRLSSMYGADRGYAASTENNVRDNERAVATNAADNVRALQANDADNARALTDRQMQEDGALARLFAAPVTVAQGARTFLPAQTAAATGLSPQLDGTAAPLNESQALAQTILAMHEADRDRIVRDKLAPTETQVQGQERTDLRARGLLTDEDLVGTIMGATPLEEVVGAGGRPEFVRRTDAVGRQPAPRSPSTVINTGASGDGKLREKLDENEGKRWSELQAAGATSAGLRQDLQLLGQLVDVAPQGPLQGRLAAAFPGFSDAGTAFQSIISRAAPGLRVEGSGATSDIEYAGMLNSLPSLRNRPEANRLIVAMMGAKADLNVERARIVNDYQNGDLDANGARRALGALNSRSIMTPELAAMIQSVGGGAAPTGAPAGSSAAPSPGTIVDGYRFRGGDPAAAASWEAL